MALFCPCSPKLPIAVFRELQAKAGFTQLTRAMSWTQAVPSFAGLYVAQARVLKIYARILFCVVVVGSPVISESAVDVDVRMLSCWYGCIPVAPTVPERRCHWQFAFLPPDLMDTPKNLISGRLLPITALQLSTSHWRVPICIQALTGGSAAPSGVLAKCFEAVDEGGCARADAIWTTRSSRAFGTVKALRCFCRSVSE